MEGAREYLSRLWLILSMIYLFFTPSTYYYYFKRLHENPPLFSGQFFKNELVCSSDVPAPAWPESPGFGRLGLEEIVSRAKSQKLGLAWPGFGPGRGFWLMPRNLRDLLPDWLMYNFAGFDDEINVKNRFIICPTLIDSLLSAGHPKSCKKHAKLQ